MRIRTISVALGLSAVVVLTVLLAGPGQNTATGTGGSSLFGDGSDGAKTYSVNDTDVPKDAVVESGTASSNNIVVSGVATPFTAGDKILIHQSRGSGAGAWELNEVQSYAVGNITTVEPLVNSYSTGGVADPERAQVLVVPQYTNLTIDVGVTVTAKAWDGATGGVIAFLVNGTATVAGEISASERGYIKGSAGSFANSTQGEGTSGEGSHSSSPNGNGGGSSSGNLAGSGGGGGHRTVGTSGAGQSPGSGGDAVGSDPLTSMFFGGGGRDDGLPTGNGGNGAGIVVLIAQTVSSTGAFNSDGQAGASASKQAGGGGAGGSILIRGETIVLGTSILSAVGGSGGTSSQEDSGGAGASGRIRTEYCTSISGGIADPPASFEQVSCSGTPKHDAINITNVFQDPLPKTCFDVMDSGQTFLFSVCDNDFQDGFPVSHAACDDGNDTVCNDEDPAEGSVTITVDPAVYHVEVGKTPLNITADATKGICSGSSTCSLTFTNTSGARPWNPWDVAGPGGSWPPDGVIDLPNDILGVIQHFCPAMSDPCAKP